MPGSRRPEGGNSGASGGERPESEEDGPASLTELAAPGVPSCSNPARTLNTVLRHGPVERERRRRGASISRVPNSQVRLNGLLAAPSRLPA